MGGAGRVQRAPPPLPTASGARRCEAGSGARARGGFVARPAPAEGRRGLPLWWRGAEEKNCTGWGGDKTEHEVNSQPKQPARLWFYPGVFSERFSYEGTVISNVGLLRLFFLTRAYLSSTFLLKVGKTLEDDTGLLLKVQGCRKAIKKKSPVGDWKVSRIGQSTCFRKGSFVKSSLLKKIKIHRF